MGVVDKHQLAGGGRQNVVHLVVFDIDGTLVDSDNFDARLYVQAVQAVLGIEIDDDWTRYDNVTDSGILNQIIDTAAPSLDRSYVHAEVKGAFVGLVAEYLRQRNGQLAEIQGAKAFVDLLKALPGVSVALATGGWAETAMMKIRGIGLGPNDLPLASASDASSRVEIMGHAEARALRGRQAQRKTYFGDGPWDKKASTELGYDFVAIGENVEHAPRYRDFSSAGDILAELGLVG